MDHQSKRELADSILAVARSREASWDGDRYAITYTEVADQAGVDTDLAPLVVAMLQSGFCDSPEWAERYASAHQAPVEGA